jgi:antitoxin VapB
VTHTTTARLFQNGRSQAVRLPREFRFQGDRVRIRRVGRGVLLEPLVLDPDEWFGEMDSLGTDSLLPQARDQPLSPCREIDLA